MPITRSRSRREWHARGAANRAAALACALVAASTSVAQSLGPVVDTADGAVRGVTIDGVESFLGLPYAAPPIGALRWRAPQPPAAWAKPRDASRYGAACPQSRSLDGPRTEVEDCLFVNVQRPPGTTAHDRLPVLVLIHGGGWLTGSGNNENLDALVRTGRVVGVTMNYRLGTLGNLALPELTREAGESGNYGYLDQRAALRWVRDNIAFFGGDPARVTIGGESAGGGSVCAHLTSPGSAGLFHQAFMMSGLCVAVPRPAAEAQGRRIAAELGCSGDIVRCLRDKPVGALLDAKTIADRATSGMRFLPSDPWEAVKSGRFFKVPMLIGSVRDEGRSFIADWATRTVPTYDAASYPAWVRRHFGDKADAVLTAYPYPDGDSRYTGSYLVADLMIQDFTPGPGGLSPCKTNRIASALAARTPTWEYEFAHPTGSGWYDVPGYVWGAGHAAELPYLIPKRGNGANNARSFGDDDQALSTQMLGLWTTFVRSGDPDDWHALGWRRYEGTDPTLLELHGGGHSVVVPVTAYRAEHRCALWDTIF